MNVLEIKKVSKYYGQFNALSDVSFNISQGDFVGLLGVNGAGKTTLISSIAGINSFTGQIKVMGHDVITDVVRAKRNLGVVPQELAYDPFLTVYQTLKFQAGLYGVRHDKKWLDEVIEGMHLTDKIDTNTRGLSGGMKRRLMVAQALVHRPPVIILDEPTAGVDVEIRKSLWKFIKTLHNAGHTILLTTHYLEEVEQVCNKIVMIDKGRILAQSSTADLMKQAHDLPTTVRIETMGGNFAPGLKDKVLNQDGNVFTLRLNNSDELLLILNTLKQANVNFGDININRPSLEDVFINCLHHGIGSGS
ncbi:MAG: transporter ATP-binding protein [Burkholderiales bacterium]|nr:transporter ATP-binding protein [Burkholderiales bacterium]